jgi:hypothetical protein
VRRSVVCEGSGVAGVRKKRTKANLGLFHSFPSFVLKSVLGTTQPSPTRTILAKA